MLDALRVLRKHKPIAVFGVGGYAAGRCFWRLGLGECRMSSSKPNAEPGFTNKVLARISKRIAIGYENFCTNLGSQSNCYRVSRAAGVFFDCAANSGEAFRLLIYGGSQGALPINRVFVDAMDGLAGRKNELAIVHQTGDRDYNAVRTAYARREIHAEVVPFLTNMAERFAWADVIVCRAGAITAAEVAAVGRAASLFLWKSNGQPSIAQRPGDGRARAGRLISDGSGRELTAEIFSLIDQPQEIENFPLPRVDSPLPAARIVNLIERPQTCREAGRGQAHDGFRFP